MRPVLAGFLTSLLLHGAILGGVVHLHRAWSPAAGESSLPLELSMFVPLSGEDSAGTEAIDEASSAMTHGPDLESNSDPDSSPELDSSPEPEPQPEPGPGPAPPPGPEPESATNPAPKPIPGPEPEPEPEPAQPGKPETRPGPASRLEPRAVDSGGVKSLPPSHPGDSSERTPGAAPLSGGAVAGEETRQPAPAESVISEALSAAESDYEKHVRARIEANKFYPRRAKRLRREGTVGVDFSIHADGTYSRVSVGESSGTGMLDDAALEAVNKVGQFRPIPKIINRDSWEFRVVLVFELE